MQNQTLKETITLEGAGIHSGAPCKLTIEPAGENNGVTLIRNGSGECPANFHHASADESVRRTVMNGPDGSRFEQIEHVMAALAAEEITSARLTFEGPEVPFLGGGSREYCEAIRHAGKTILPGEFPELRINRPFAFEDGEAVIVATPGQGLRLSAYVDFPGTVVGSMGATAEITPDEFYQEISAARTFALASDIEKLRSAGLAKGGNLENAVVFDQEKYHNENLYYPNEVARHKLLDLLGDIALSGRRIVGHVWAWRAGHQSHVRFVQKLAKEFGIE